MIICGLDLSLTSSGVIILDNDKVIHNEAIRTKLRGVKRMSFIKERIFFLISAYKVQFVMMEGFAYGIGRKTRSSFDIGGLGWIIRLLLHELKIPFILVPPAQLKKFACGKGNAKKEFVILEIFKNFDIQFKTSDETEAYVLALLGHYYNDKSITFSLPNYKKEVISNLSIYKEEV